MPTLRGAASLVPGAARSKLDWIKRLGKDNFESLVFIGALKDPGQTFLNGFSGSFDFGFGHQEYELQISPESAFAYPSEGGTAVAITDFRNLVFCAQPVKVLEAIILANGFDLVPPVDGQSSMVAVGKRDMGGQHFKLLVVLDEQWFGTFGSATFVKSLCKGIESIILLSENIQKIFPWSIEDKVVLKCGSLPSVKVDWLIPKEWYCHPRFNIPTEAIVECYKDKKIIFDGVSKRIFVLGREVKIQEDSRPYNFLRGILLMGPSKMASDRFAKDVLKEHSRDGNVVVNGAKNQLKRAMREADLNKGQLDQACDLIMPESKQDKMVIHKLKAEDFLFWGADE